jgi:hypothetical protein
MEHLRPHPTQVSESENIARKFTFKQRTDKYLFAFDPTNYCDVEIFNIQKHKTKMYKGVQYALKYSEIPVVFFLCYDVGYREYTELGRVFVRHVVCCFAKDNYIYFFDMRNLSEISKGMKEILENEINTICNTKYKLVNLSCNHTTHCRYLQRYKGKDEMGWCIAWAMYFLDYLTDHPELGNKKDRELREIFNEFYVYTDSELSSKKSNHFIERYYIHLLSS